MRTDVWQALHDDLAAGVQPDGETYAAALGPHRLLLPLRQLADGRRLASLILNQASFAVLDALADRVAEGVAAHAPDLVVAVPTLGLPLAEGVARRLGHPRLVPLGTSRKFWYDEALSVPLASITTQGPGRRLYVDPRMLPLLHGRRVAVIDDVISTGASMAAVLELLGRTGARVAVIGAAMLQGEAARGRFDPLPVVTAIETPVLGPKEAGA